MTGREPAPALEDFEFFHELRVRWAEVDPQGIVFNASYLVYADVAFTEYMRAVGFPYPAGLDPYESDLFVVSASADYAAPARFDDMLSIGVRIERFGRTSMRFAIGVFRDGDPLARIGLTYVHASREAAEPVPIPQAFVERVQTFEKREPDRS